MDKARDEQRKRDAAAEDAGGKKLDAGLQEVSTNYMDLFDTATAKRSKKKKTAKSSSSGRSKGAAGAGVGGRPGGTGGGAPRVVKLRVNVRDLLHLLERDPRLRTRAHLYTGWALRVHTNAVKALKL